MTSPKIEKVLSDPDAVALLGEAIEGLTAAELVVLRQRLTRARREWAHEMRQREQWARMSFAAWRGQK